MELIKTKNQRKVEFRTKKDEKSKVRNLSILSSNSTDSNVELNKSSSMANSFTLILISNSSDLVGFLNIL